MTDLLIPIVSTIKYEISLFRKLINSKQPYYSVYILTLILKHFAEFILLNELKTQARAFSYLQLLKEKNIISKEEEEFINVCVTLVRRKDKLVKEYKTVDVEKMEKIVRRIENIILSSASDIS
ncbi:MAG: hypothetical protein ABDH28_02090 [Brevinematia bacterium]